MRRLRAGDLLSQVLPPDLESVARKELAEAGVDASYVAFVARHLDRPDAEWRWCCGSACDPCVNRLGRVVDAVRARRGGAPEGMPKSDASP